MKQILTILLLNFATLVAVGQNQEDALRYSIMNPIGTARYAGAGGAFGSMGADISVMATNPAGLARLRSSIFSFTPEVSSVSTSTDFRNNFTPDSKTALNFSSLGLVGTAKAAKDSPYLWRSVQYGIAYNKTALFNNNYTVSGVSDTSLAYQFAGVAGYYGSYGIPPDSLSYYDPYQSGLAYNTNLISANDYQGSSYSSNMTGGGYSFTNNTKETGSIGETDLTIAANYNDKLYLGGTVGFAKLRYNRVRTHSEYSSDSASPVSYFDYTEYLQTSGKGINLKLGVVVLPIKQLRIGLAIHTKTKFYYLQDTWHNEMYTNMHDTANYSSSSSTDSYMYTLKTPSKLILSASGVIAKRLIVSGEAEVVDYGTSLLGSYKFENYKYSFAAENENIKTMYQRVVNIRTGVEFRVTKPIIARAGFAMYGSPYQIGVTQNSARMLQFSGGIGYHTKKYYLDLGYTLAKYRQDYYMYDPVLVEDTPISISKSNILATLGFKF